MTEFFSSAFGYLSNLSGQTNGAVLNGVIEIGTVKLRIKKVIAEGTHLYFTDTYKYMLSKLICSPARNSIECDGISHVLIPFLVWLTFQFPGVVYIFRLRGGKFNSYNNNSFMIFLAGGFSTIFAAQALDSGKIYALKASLIFCHGDNNLIICTR